MSQDAFSPTLDYAAAFAPRKAMPSRLSLRRLRTDRWTVGHGVAAGIMGLLGVAATFEAWNDIFHIARGPGPFNRGLMGYFDVDTEYSHIFIVPLVAFWMVVVRRLRFRHCKPTGTGIGFIMAACGWGLSAFGYYHGYQTLWHAGSIVVVLGCVLSVLGKHVLFRFFPAVAVLVFLVPVPPHIRLRIAGPLQSWTAQISQTILDLFGVAVERSGNKLSINGVDVNIIEACNGLRMVFALILVSYAFSFGMPLRNSVRFLILLASPLSAIFCNVVRIVPNVLVYGYYSQHAGYEFHRYSGWLMLPISFLVLLGIIRILRWVMIPVMKYTLAS